MKQIILTAVLVTGLSNLMLAQVVGQKPIRKGMLPISKTVVHTDPAPQYEIRNLNGKWQEIKRITARNERKEFADTLMLMLSNGHGILKSSNDMNMVMKGEASVESGNMLSVAGSEFTLLGYSGSYLTLKDEEGMTRSLKRVKRFYGETVGKDSIKLPVYTTPVNAEAALLNGKWDVYRRDAEPGFITNTTTLVRSISFNTISGNGGTGEVTTYTGSDNSITSPMKFSVNGSTLTISTDKQDLTVSVYKADGKEFVFGRSGAILSFAKH